jgi:hypothetical protein
MINNQEWLNDCAIFSTLQELFTKDNSEFEFIGETNVKIIAFGNTTVKSRERVDYKAENIQMTKIS